MCVRGFSIGRRGKEANVQMSRVRTLRIDVCHSLTVWFRPSHSPPWLGFLLWDEARLLFSTSALCAVKAANEVNAVRKRWAVGRSHVGRGRVPPVDSSGWEITDEVDLNPGRGCGHPAMRSSDPCNRGGRRGQNKLPQESCRLSQLGPGQRGTGRTLSACAAISSRRRLPFSSLFCHS